MEGRKLEAKANELPLIKALARDHPARASGRLATLALRFDSRSASSWKIISPRQFEYRSMESKSIAICRKLSRSTDGLLESKTRNVVGRQIS